MHWFLEAGPFSARDGEGRLLFDDAVVRLPEGEAVLLQGPSGSGKSTLLRRVAGLESSQDGQRVLAGEPHRRARLPRWRARVVLLAQDAPTLPGSVQDNLEFPFRLRCAADRRYDDGRARHVLAAVGLERIPFDRAVTTLSGGERHRLALARGLLWQPQVLMADEPLSGLDADSAEMCFEELLRFARRPGYTVLMALHSTELGRRADRTLRLEGGRLEES
jgi:ABC-type iron transport system FetAB ATPase subunit